MKKKQANSKIYRFFCIGLIAAGLWRCSIVIPPITLTGEKTALEKQIVGDEKQIEKDAWMIASAAHIEEKTITPEEQKTEQKQKKQIEWKIFRALRVIAFFRKKTLEYRNNYIIGENKDGYVSFLPPLAEKGLLPKQPYYAVFTEEVKNTYLKGKEYQKVLDYIDRINKARKEIEEASIAAIDPSLPEDQKQKEIEQIRSKLRQDYLNELTSGHWYEDPAIGWKQK